VVGWSVDRVTSGSDKSPVDDSDVDISYRDDNSELNA
jgi:hypothetical protein